MGPLSALRAAGIDGNTTVEGIQRALRQLTGGGDIEAVDAPNGMSVYRRLGVGPVTDHGLAWIADEGPDGEDEPTDASYYVRWYRPAAGNTAVAMSVEPSAVNGRRAIELATNVSEMDGDTGTSGTHLLRVDTPVHVFSVPDGNGVDRLWFFRPIQNPFVCLCTVDGGSAGSDSTTCDFTYTITDLAGNNIPDGDTLTPKRPRFTNVEYETPSAGSPGLAYYDANGDIQLYEVVEEVPMTDACPAE